MQTRIEERCVETTQVARGAEDTELKWAGEASQDTSGQSWLLRGAEQPLMWTSRVSQHGAVCGETLRTKDAAVGICRDKGLAEV